jgi:hypothetical protein
LSISSRSLPILPPVSAEPARLPAGKSGSELRSRHKAATYDLYLSQPILWNKEDRLALARTVQLTKREEYFNGWFSIRAHLSSLEIKGNSDCFRATVKDCCYAPASSLSWATLSQLSYL